MVDSLTAVRPLRDVAVEAILDLGSGGGFPGLPLVAAVPLNRAALVDSVGKKAAFLRAATVAVGLDDRVEVVNERAEALAVDQRHRARWPAVAARAVTSLAELVELSFPLLEVGGRLIAWKRGDVDAETGAARRAVEGLGGGSIEFSDVDVPGLAGHRLAIVTKVSPTPRQYPRDPAARRRSPW